MSTPAHITIATAGHIDHGKSTLVEALTGVHPDRLKEERARGISIELGFAHATFEDLTVSFVDVPGHERFVRHMLAGIGGIDGLLCVVAADESVMPQTREHLAIARLLGVPRGVIALTKADLVDADLLDLVRLEVEEQVAAGPLADAPVIPVSARTGQGLDAVRGALHDLARHRAQRDADAPARLPVDRVFSVRGFGTVVTGTLWTGRLAVDQEVVALPTERRWRIRGLQVHGGAATEAHAGQRVAVNLAGATTDDVSRGDVIAQPGGLLVTRRLDARLETLPGAPILRHGARVHLHLGTTETLARVSLIASDEIDQVREWPGGSEGWVRLRLEQPVAARQGDRFVVRAYSPVTTVAGGVVVDPLPPRRSSRAHAAARLREMVTSDAGLDRRLSILVRESSVQGVALDVLPPRLGVSPDVVDALVVRAIEAREIVGLDERLVSVETLNSVVDAVMALVDAHHASDPTSDGVPRQSVRERLGRRGGVATVERAVAMLLQQQALRVTDDRLGRPAHLDARTALITARTRVQTALQQCGLEAATADLLRQASALDASAADAVVRGLVRDNLALKLGELYVDAGAVARVADDLRALQERGELEAIHVGWFKERYGVTRRTAIPLLELLDRQRVTRRVGEARIVLGG